MTTQTQARRMAPAEMLHRIEVLAARKQHRLANDMCGGRPLTLAGALKVLANLERCPDKPRPQPQPSAPPAAASPEQPVAPSASPMPPPMSAFRHVPAGYYAVPCRTGVNDLSYYRVSRPKDGKWAGYLFLTMIVGGKPEFPVKGMNARLALQQIVTAGIGESMALYGRTIGKCGRCGRTLTDDVSRSRGIGPTCAAS